LEKLDPEKLSVTFVPPVTPTDPIRFRRYTLTHSDDTGKLFLTVGLYYDFDKINPETRDEVLGEWALINPNYYALQLIVYVGNSNFEVAQRRYNVFLKELPLAIEAILYGDKELFKKHPELLGAPISVRFISSFPQFNIARYYNRPIDYFL